MEQFFAITNNHRNMRIPLFQLIFITKKNKFPLFLSTAIFLTFCTEFSSQTVDINSYKLKPKISFEKVQMNNEPDLGMIGIGADVFLFKNIQNLYATLNSYSTITGERPGLISFGVGAGYLQPIPKTPLSIDAGIFVGGGGGGSAKVGGGLILREHLNLVYSVKDISIFAGYSRLDFPMGNIGSNNVNVGLTINTQLQNSKMTNETSGKNENLNYKKLRITPHMMSYMNFSKSPIFKGSKNVNEDKIMVMGIELDKFLTKDIYAALKLDGGVRGGIDGYMCYLVGFGYNKNILKNILFLDAELLAGPSGGGKINSDGGATFQGSASLRTHIANGFSLKLGLGKTISSKGSFNGNFFEIGLSKDLNLASENREGNYLLKKGEKLQNFEISASNRSYFTTNGVDKGGDKYDSFFNLIGLEVSKKLGNNFSVFGSTLWAYQGSYGAYAEGILGVRKTLKIEEGLGFHLQGGIGAAGGGGIDVGTGLTLQYGLGLEKNISKNAKVFLTGGKINSIKGNFHPFYADLGFALSIGKVQKLKE